MSACRAAAIVSTPVRSEIERSVEASPRGPIIIERGVDYERVCVCAVSGVCERSLCSDFVLSTRVLIH